jgi:hypothetical protein
VLAELLALLDVGHGLVERPLGDADGLGADRDAGVVEGGRAILSPLADGTDDAVAGDAAVVEVQLTVGEPLMPSLRSFSPKVNPSSDFSTTKAVMLLPRGPSGSVTASTV